MGRVEVEEGAMDLKRVQKITRAGSAFKMECEKAAKRGLARK